MTEKDLIARAMRLLDPAPGSPVWGEREIEIASAIPQALREFGVIVAKDPKLSAHLTQEYQVTLSGGIGNMAGVVGSVTGVANEYIWQAKFPLVRDNSSNVLYEIESYKKFVRPLSRQYGYYHKENQRIRTRASGVVVIGPSGITTAVSPIFVTAHYVPASITNVPAELSELLVDVLYRLLKGEMPGVAALGGQYQIAEMSNAT